MSDLSSYPMVHQALVALGKDFYMDKGGDPQTEAEWARLQKAMIGGAYHMYRANGVPKAEDKSMARLLHGGLAGRLLLEMAFSESESEEVA